MLTHLTHLDLSEEIGEELSVSFMSTIQELQTCSYRGYCSGTHYNVSRNWNFSDSGAYCQGLQHNTSLVHLNLNNTYIGLVATEDTAQALTTMLQVNKALTHLDLSRNWSFLESGAYFVFQGLQHNTSLVHLNLS